MAVDPVCGMEVDAEGSATMTYQGQTYFFCSMGCKRRFEEDPERYTSGMEFEAEDEAAA